ncbi:hypothetical protein CHS0354_012199 [Potamilus streckersoni]|uniref:Sulfatase N-terminal domain-containing protein n=1 Tax=Potamilus streckersoni TaxID=2493646 RepID=A0AAE0SA49_9BIVA|nr:hypothetical protein CHS0354_012199 [Potamilus streckersoni]
MEMTRILSCLCICLFLIGVGSVKESQPNIVFIVADDLGWNDVGFHNPDMLTPNIDKLASGGVILNQSYVEPLCTPSRHAFMTGIYPYKSGMQHMVIYPEQPYCSPLNLTFLPQKLKKLGYDTHMIGKWHLGMCKWECTPTYRGFDTFYGYYQAQEDYYNKTVLGGLDFRDGKEVVRDDKTYSPITYAKRADWLISQHNKSRPMFLYLPFQSVHEPIQVPKKYEDLYPNIKTDGRRKYSGMVSALDEAIGNVTDSLKRNGMFDNTFIIFTADNGGWPTYYGNNYPLRGGKTTVYEGGTRASAFIYGAGLTKAGYTYNGLIHAVDWNPTLVAVAGGQPDEDIDGINLWEEIRSGSASKRTEFVYHIDEIFTPFEGHEAIRVGDYKLIQGYPGPYPGWYKPDEVTGDQGVEKTDYRHASYLRFYRSANASIELGAELFNLKDDPYEHNNLARDQPELVKKMEGILQEYKKHLVPAMHPPEDKKGNPKNFGGVWTPGWC